MRAFTTGLILFAASSSAAQFKKPKQPYALPQYEGDYDPECDYHTPLYTDYSQWVDCPACQYPGPTEKPLLDHTMRLAQAWANPYYESKEVKDYSNEKMDEAYDEGVKIVKGVAHGYEKLQKKHEAEYKRMEPAYEEPQPVQYVSPPAEPYRPLPITQIVTPYEWYAHTGQCELTDQAYGQCVSWKQQSHYHEPTYAAPEPYRKSAYQQKSSTYEKQVAKVNPYTGQGYLERQYVQGPPLKPTYGEITWRDADDLYKGTTTLPVEITDSYGRSRLGSKVVIKNKDDTKDVTIIDEDSGQTNTLRLKDSQRIENIQEVDHDNDYRTDQQVVTVCDDYTKTCDVIAIDLDSDYVKPGYKEHVYDEIHYAEDSMPYESSGEPTIIDPLSVGAEEDDVCWLEDIIVGHDYNGDAIVEQEIFCADAEALYMEPYTDEYDGVHKDTDDWYDAGEDWYGDDSDWYGEEDGDWYGEEDQYADDYSDEYGDDTYAEEYDDGEYMDEYGDDEYGDWGWGDDYGYDDWGWEDDYDSWYGEGDEYYEPYADEDGYGESYDLEGEDY